MVCIICYMTIVELEKQTHAKLIKVKKEMKKSNKPIYKINNNVVIKHALNKVEELKEYEITNVD